MADRVLVTGAAGFIGSHLVDALLGRGFEVVGLDNLTSGRMENLSDTIDKIELIEGDITDFDTVSDICGRVDFVVHHAALVSVRESVDMPKEYNRVNVDGTINLLEASRKGEVKRFVMASSSAVYGECAEFPETESMLPAPTSPYALTKLTGEHYCRIYFELFGLQTICFRYFNVYGPRQNPFSQYASVIPIFSSKLAAGEQPTIFGTGDQTRDFVYVGDVCGANLAALSAPESACGRAFNVASGTFISVNELYRLIAGLVGREDIQPIHGDPQPGDVLQTHGSNDLCRRELGFQPEMIMEKGLSGTVAFYTKQST